MLDIVRVEMTCVNCCCSKSIESSHKDGKVPRINAPHSVTVTFFSQSLYLLFFL